MDKNDKKKGTIIFHKCSVAFLLLITILNLVLLSNIVSMKKEIEDVKNNIFSNRDYLNNLLSDHMHSIETTLKEEASIVSEFTFEFGEYNDKKVDIILNVQPKSYTQGEKVYFSYKAGENSSHLIEAHSNDGINFSANFETSIFDDLTIDLVIDDGDTKRIEKLDKIYAPVHDLTAELSARPIGCSYKYNESTNTVNTDYEVGLLVYDEDFHRTIQNVNLIIEVNDKKIESISMNIDELSKEEGTTKYLAKLENYEIYANKGDTINFFITAKDDLGLNYKIYLEGWIIEDEGQLRDIYEKYGEVEIY